MNNVLRHSYVVYWNVSTVLHPRGTPSIRAFFFLLIFLFCFYTTVTCAYNVNLVCCWFVGDLQKEMSSKFTLSIETLFAITISFIIHYLIWGIAEKAMLQQEHDAVVGGQQAATCITGHINNRLLYIFVVDITLLVLSAKRARAIILRPIPKLTTLTCCDVIWCFSGTNATRQILCSYTIESHFGWRKIYQWYGMFWTHLEPNRLRSRHEMKYVSFCIIQHSKSNVEMACYKCYCLF